MITKEEIIKKSKQVDIDDFIIGHGSALVLHGIRESTNDIDAGTDKETFKNLEGYVVELENWKMIRNYQVDDFDIHLMENYDEYDYQLIEGVKVATPQQVIEDKKSLGRLKDWEQIKMIEKHLS